MPTEQPPRGGKRRANDDRSNQTPNHPTIKQHDLHILTARLKKPPEDSKHKPPPKTPNNVQPPHQSPPKPKQIPLSTITPIKNNIQVIIKKIKYRYFTEGMKCFRCKKMGHYDYACLD